MARWRYLDSEFLLRMADSLRFWPSHSRQRKSWRLVQRDKIYEISRKILIWWRFATGRCTGNWLSIEFTWQSKPQKLNKDTKWAR